MIMNAKVSARRVKRFAAGLAIGGMTLRAVALLDGQGARMGDAVLRTAQHDPAKELAMNNHTMDEGVDGMFHTMRVPDEAGITNAGTGKDLDDARSARFAATPKGVVGIVGMYAIDSASSPPESRYTDARAPIGLA